MILCDVARPEASIIVEELRQLGIARDGSISMEPVETQLSAAADAAGRALEELPFGDAVVWEEVEARTSEETSLSINFVELMMIAALIAAVGILLDSPILIVGAMVVGPEFGPVAGFCVAVVQRRGDLARRSATALAVGIAAAVAATIAGRSSSSGRASTRTDPARCARSPSSSPTRTSSRSSSPIWRAPRACFR